MTECNTGGTQFRLDELALAPHNERQEHSYE